MRELKVSASDEGIRLNKLAARYLNAAPQSFIYKMLRKKNIVLNDKKASGDERLKAGDSVKLYLSEETIEGFIKKAPEPTVKKAAGKLHILFENEDILAVSKPAGMLTQKAKKDDHSLNDELLEYYAKSGRKAEPGFKPSVANRLDRNTTGIVLCGISPAGSRRLAAALKEHTLKKYYFTICHGKISKKITVDAYIKRDGLVSKVRKTDGADDGEHVVTHFYPIDNKGGYSLIKAELETGKTHQIRASLKSIGLPIVGDAKYGSPAEDIAIARACGIKGHLLHAGLLIVPKGVFDDEEHVIIDELPRQFRRLAERLSLDIKKQPEEA